MKIKTMKKTTLILGILVILGLGFLSKKIEGNNKVKETSVENFFQEDELQLEDWMTTPFVVNKD
jgi:hypothetical protein